MTANPRFIDTHAHLDSESFSGKVAETVEAAASVGVDTIVNVGYRPSVWPSTLALVDRFPAIACMLGIHPNHADEATSANLDSLRELVERTRPVAIGEIGLDFYREHASSAVQMRAFEAQLHLAERASLPVVIHQRAAEDVILPYLERWSQRVQFVLHSFEGTRAFFEKALGLGMVFGVGGLATRAQSADLRAFVAEMAADRFVLETDSPYLKPAGIRGTRNSPANIPRIASLVAEVRGVSVDDVARQTTANALRFFPRLAERRDDVGL